MVCPAFAQRATVGYDRAGAPWGRGRGRPGLQSPSLLRNRALWTVMSGHFAVDHFSGLMPALYPLLVATFGFSIGQIGLLAAVYMTALSLTQPVFGYLADRIGTRWLSGVSVLWMAAASPRSVGCRTSRCWCCWQRRPPSAQGLSSNGRAQHLAGGRQPAEQYGHVAVYARRHRRRGDRPDRRRGCWRLGIGATALLALPALAIGLWLLVEMRAVDRSRAPAGRRRGEPPGATRQLWRWRASSRR